MGIAGISGSTAAQRIENAAEQPRHQQPTVQAEARTNQVQSHAPSGASKGPDLGQALGQLFMHLLGGATHAAQQTQGAKAEGLDLSQLLIDVGHVVDSLTFDALDLSSALGSVGGPPGQWKADGTAKTTVQRGGDAVGGTTSLGHVKAEVQEGAFRASAEATAQATAEGYATSESSVGGGRASGAVKAGARVGVTGGAKVKCETPVGSAYAGVKGAAAAWAQAEAEGQAHLLGASGRANASTGAMATADAYAGGNVIGGIALDAKATAESGCGADAHVEAGLSIVPAQAIASGAAGAFAGARAAAKVSSDVLGAKNTTTVGALAGAGAEASFKFGLDESGHLKIEWSLSVCLGVGLQIGSTQSYDPKDFGQVAVGALTMLGLVLTGSPVWGLIGMVPGLFGGKSANGEHAAKTIDAAVGEPPDGGDAQPKPQSSIAGGFVQSEGEPALFDTIDDTAQRVRSLREDVKKMGTTKTTTGSKTLKV